MGADNTFGETNFNPKSSPKEIYESEGSNNAIIENEECHSHINRSSNKIMKEKIFNKNMIIFGFVPYIILTALIWIVDIIAIIFYGYEASFWLFIKTPTVLFIFGSFGVFVLYPILYKIYKKL